MSVHMKKPRTSHRMRGNHGKKIRITIENGRKTHLYLVSETKAVEVSKKLQDFEVTNEDFILADDALRDLYQKYSKPGALLQGSRLKEEITQVQLAKRMGIPQQHISEMENGKRPIGKKTAKRLAKIFKTDYRVFL